MIIDKNYKTVEDICNEVINSNLSDKAKIKTIQASKVEITSEEKSEKEIKEDQSDEMVLCD